MTTRKCLQEARVKYGYSQVQISEGLGCSRSTIVQIERGLINSGYYFAMYYAIMLEEAIQDPNGRDIHLINGLIKERNEEVNKMINPYIYYGDKKEKVERIKQLVEKLGGHEDGN